MAQRLVSRKPFNRMKIAASQNWKCDYCKISLPATFEIDHIHPLSLGGSDTLDNLHAVCPNCHRKKTVQDEEFRRDQIMEDLTGISKYFNPKCTAFHEMKRKTGN